MSHPLDPAADRRAAARPAPGADRVGSQRSGPPGPAGAPEQAVDRLAAVVERLRGELERVHADAAARSLVEMAAGVLVERLRCGPAEAAAQLAVLAERAGVPVLEVAADLVDRAAADRISALAGAFTGTAAARPDPAALRLRSAEAGALTADTAVVARSILENALRPLGAVAVAVWAARPDQSLALAGSAGFGDAEAQRWRHVPPGVATPARRALDER
ncbi:ANTAR domain-containing protein, partial [Kitasatospora sp. NPDC058965]|uniref:ANTAR domain-containing protein n=1 Tax=Kitasatospora sp. NPDC058965 TaxID=3346682 RepID=UPI0036802B3F